MSLKTEVRNAIAEICMEKYQKRIEPRHALGREIYDRVKRPQKDIQSCINEMVRNGELEWGRTINDNYFRNVPRK